MGTFIRFLPGILLLLAVAGINLCEAKNENKKIKAMIIDGQSSHGLWPKSTLMLKDYLEETGLFQVDIARTYYTWQGPHHNAIENINDITELLDMYHIEGMVTEKVDEPKPDPDYKPEFDQYDVIVSNFGWMASDWPENTKTAFKKYMKNGGGLVIVHAANNSFGEWEEFNEMIGLGGWGGRTSESGTYIYYNDQDELIRDDADGESGAHGAQHEYIVMTRENDHPVMKGLPDKWLHAKDELYERLRGPANNLTILATAFSDEEINGTRNNKGSGRHEPILFTVQYGQGRVFHTTMGHMDYSLECVGFITTFQRGAEWVATGKVTQKIPVDFPGIDASSSRNWRK